MIPADDDRYCYKFTEYYLISDGLWVAYRPKYKKAGKNENGVVGRWVCNEYVGLYKRTEPWEAADAMTYEKGLSVLIKRVE